MIDLKPFCATDERRPAMLEPFSLGDFTYATDGHAIIRVPRRDSVPPNRDNDFAARFRKWALSVLLDAALAERAFAAPPAHTVVPGKPGKKCPECNGKDSDCWECGGDGVVGEIDGRARYASHDFNSRYIALIAGLPGLEVAFGPEAARVFTDGVCTGLASALVFRFDGGVGCLMPMVRPDNLEEAA